MDLRKLQRTWDALGKRDALWAILTAPEKKDQRWDREEFFETGRREIADVFDYLARLGLVPNRNGKALDFGCGVGRLTQALAAYFDVVYGVDIAPSMIELANQYNRFSAKCRYTVNSSNNLSVFSDGTFDFIYSNLVLQHMQPKYARGYIKEFLRLLGPRGILLFQQPSREVVQRSSAARFSVARRIARLVVPSVVVDLYRNKIQTRRESSNMEMYEIRKAQAVKLIQKYGGDVIDILEDKDWGDWISFRYCVRKRG